MRRLSLYPALAKLAFPCLAALIFGLGLFLRLADLSNPPLDFHPTRKFFGVIRSRHPLLSSAFPFRRRPSVPLIRSQ